MAVTLEFKPRSSKTQACELGSGSGTQYKACKDRLVTMYDVKYSQNIEAYMNLLLASEVATNMSNMPRAILPSAIHCVHLQVMTNPSKIALDQ